LKYSSPVGGRERGEVSPNLLWRKVHTRQHTRPGLKPTQTSTNKPRAKARSYSVLGIPQEVALVVRHTHRGVAAGCSLRENITRRWASAQGLHIVTPPSHLTLSFQTK
jgi:hypothetical protein